MCAFHLQKVIFATLQNARLMRHTPQRGNDRIFLSLRFFVKSKIGEFRGLKSVILTN